jgi:hypothetical protein
MQSRTAPGRQSQLAAIAFVIGLLFIALPIIITVLIDQQPFPGTVVGPSEVAPVLGLITCIIATLIIIQDIFGY